MNEELVELYQQGDNKSLDKLIQVNIGIIKKIATKYNGINRELEFDDLFQSGVLGFIKAAQKYDSNNEKKAKFITYAIHYIGRYIHSCVNGNNTKEVENNKFYHECTSLNKLTGENEETEILEYIADEESGFENIEEKLFLNNIRKELEEVMQECNTLEQREIIKLRHGWNSNPMTLNEIGEVFNITGNKARLIERTALRKLRGSKWARENKKELEELGYIKGYYLDLFNSWERLYCD